MEYVGGTVAEGPAQEADGRQRRAVRPVPASTRRSPTSSRSCRRSATCTTWACCTATSSRTTSSRSATRVKLIDLGGVRRIDDLDSPIYGTRRLPGARGRRGRPVGRVRHLHARPHARGARRWSSAATSRRTSSSLPPVAETPLFQRYDSFYRLLAKACALDPADRFQTADELRVQLLGVLREIVATAQAPDGGRGPALGRRPCCSRRPIVEGDTLDWQHAARAQGRPRRPDGRLALGAVGDRARADRMHAALRRPAGDRRGAPRPGPDGDRGRPAATSPTAPSRTMLRGRPVGVAGRLGVGPRSARGRRRRRRRGRRSTPSTGRCPGELAPEARAGRCRASGPASTTSPRRLRRLRAHRRELHRARRVRPGPDPAAPGATSTAPSRRSTWCPRRAARTSRRGGSAPRLLAASGPRPARSVGRVGQYRVRDHRPARPRPAAHRRAGRRARRRARTGPAGVDRDRRVPAVGAGRCATRSSGAYRELAALTPDARRAGRARRPRERRAPVDAAVSERDGPST